MKKFFVLFLVFIYLSALPVSAIKLDSDKITYTQQIGKLFSAQTADGKYLLDENHNVLSGPYPQISDFSGFAYAETADGGKIMFDENGEILASVKKGGEIHPPANGIYIVSPNTNKTDGQGEYIIYDYETRKELFKTDTFIFYYLEQQSEKIFIERNGKYALISRDGKYLTDFIYDGVKKRFNPDYAPYPKAYAIVIQNGEEKYIDWNLNEINLENYNGERFITQFYSVAKSDGQTGDFYVGESGDFSSVYDNKTGKFLFPFIKEIKISALDSNLILCKKGDKMGAIDYSGNEKIPFIYENLSLSGWDNGFYIFTKDGKFGLLDGDRNIPVSDFAGVPTENGIMIKNYTDYSSGYKKYCAEIVNFRGRNLTGEVYLEVKYENGNYFYTNIRGDYEDINTPVYFDKNFAIINLNGKYLPFDGVIKDDRTLVPMREICEGLGGKVTWNEKTRTAKADFGKKQIEMTIDNNIIKVNGENQTIDVPAQLINEKTMLPVRALCENLEAFVEWDELIKCVYITK